MASFQQLLKDKGKTLNISEMVIPKIQMIHYKKLHGSQKNFYSKERIEELADAIEIAGMILQPLIVCKTDMGEYDVLAGHRRLAADTYNVEEKGLKKFEQVPCIEIVAGEVIKEMIENNKEKRMTAEEAMDVFAEFVIITTNSTGRGELTDYEKVMQAARLRIIIPIMTGDEELKGRALRAEIAKEMGKSDGMIGNYMNIYNNLIPAGMEMLEHGLIGITMASKICSLKPEYQEELLRQERITEEDILRYKRQDIQDEKEENSDGNEEGEDISQEELDQAIQELDDLMSDLENDSEETEKQESQSEEVYTEESCDDEKGKEQEMVNNMAAGEGQDVQGYSDVIYGKEDVAHLLDVYKAQVDRVSEIAKSSQSGQMGNESVLKKSVIIRDALSMYISQM